MSEAIQLQVETPGGSYPIHIGETLEPLREQVQPWIEAERPLAIVLDAHVAGHWTGLMRELFGTLPRYLTPPGENAKSFQQLEKLTEFLAASRVDRTGGIVVVGGGVTGDLGGFAAASYLRGIAFFQVPTTLLSMVDSAVGGKTGINLAAGKNLVGAFHQPQGVFSDVRFLQTLPAREFSAGLAETVKYGLLGDLPFFEELEAMDRLGPDHPLLPKVIARCCTVKARIVGEDEREWATQGGRALLNLGHTFGHAIEATAGYGAYLHGEAIAVGMVLAARLSEELGFLKPEAVERVRALLARYELPVRLREALPLEGLMDAIKRDKKVRTGRLRFIIMEALGHAVVREDVPDALVRELWREAGAD